MIIGHSVFIGNRQGSERPLSRVISERYGSRQLAPPRQELCEMF